LEICSIQTTLSFKVDKHAAGKIKQQLILLYHKYICTTITQCYLPDISLLTVLSIHFCQKHAVLFAKMIWHYKVNTWTSEIIHRKKPKKKSVT